ncbi:hypothetical protein GIY62_31765 [Burkholderia plantarii]|nr:hypothetical protein GIY62_31765 [Burkholderia plantarii]
MKVMRRSYRVRLIAATRVRAIIMTKRFHLRRTVIDQRPARRATTLSRPRPAANRVAGFMFAAPLAEAARHRRHAPT